MKSKLLNSKVHKARSLKQAEFHSWHQFYRETKWAKWTQPCEEGHRCAKCAAYKIAKMKKEDPVWFIEGRILF